MPWAGAPVTATSSGTANITYRALVAVLLATVSLGGSVAGQRTPGAGALDGSDGAGPRSEVLRSHPLRRRE